MKRHEAAIVVLTNHEHKGGGTGFQLNFGSHQFTITNAHVCEMAGKDHQLEAASPLLPFTPIKILAKSPYTDLCILEPVKSLPALDLRFGDFNKGDKLEIWGHPRLRPLEKAKGKVIVKSHVIDVMLDFIYTIEQERACRQPKNEIIPSLFGPACIEHVRAQETSAQIEPGNSGSPVFDEAGKVGGVAFAGAVGANDHANGEIVPWASLYIFLMNYTQQYVDLTH